MTENRLEKLDHPVHWVIFNLNFIKLGMLFDHGCDSLATLLMSMMLVNCLLLG